MLILASNSPRRKQLLTLSGWQFHVIPANVAEQANDGELPHAYVLRLAQEKALAVGEHAPGGRIIVAADTTVADGNQILGKPVSAAEAVTMLRGLCGRVHQVYTGLAVFRPADRVLLTDQCVTDVKMRSYTEAEIQAYVATGDPLDKAGGYAIQHREFRPVESLAGCYANVVGLPMCRLAPLLEQIGLSAPTGAPIVCRDALQNRCAFFELVH